MQHDRVPIKLNFDLLTIWPQPQVQGVGDGERGLQAKCLQQFCCIHDSLQFGMQYEYDLKKLNLAFLPHPLGSWGVCGQNICYHATELCDSLSFDMQHDHVLKKLSFDLLTPSPGSEGGKIFDTMLLHSRSHSVCGLRTGNFAPLVVVLT